MSHKKLFARSIAHGGKNAVENVVGKEVGGEKRQDAAAAIHAVQAHFQHHHIKVAQMLLHHMVVGFHQARIHGVVAVVKHHPFAFGFHQTPIACRRCGLKCFLRHHHLEIFGGMRLLELAQHLQRAVGASIVDQHHLQRAVGLRQHRSQSGFHLFSTIINGYDNRKQHLYPVGFNSQR